MGRRGLKAGWRGIRRGRLVTAVAVAIGGAPSVRAADRVFSPAWFAARTTGAAASGGPGGGGARALTGAGVAGVGASRARSLQQSIADITAAAQAVSRIQAAQQSVAAAARPAGRGVPDGLAPGGLQIAAGAAAPASPLWIGARLPTQASSAGRQVVTVQQTAPTAVLNWDSFSVGGNTTLAYQQGASNWVALNRVSPAAAPSTILGAITAPGQVLVINRNGIIFGAGAQVSVGALTASTAELAAAGAATGAAYAANAIKGGIYQGFAGATKPIVVEAGAQITTLPPVSAVDRGGAVLLLGSAVTNAGSIATPNGQALLAAGRDFHLRQGLSPSSGAGATGQANPTSTTLGTELEVTAGGGMLTNSGIVRATTGDITLVGQTIIQSGVLSATTSVAQRGTIHVLTDRTDPASSITLDAGSVTAIVPETGGATATAAQRQALIDLTGTQALGHATLANGLRALNNQSQPLDPTYSGGLNFNDSTGSQVSVVAVQADRLDQSRIEITSGGSVRFAGRSLTLAIGGQAAVTAGPLSTIPASPAGRIQAEMGAVIDVGGSPQTSLGTDANTLTVNIQGFELRDSPGNRDTGKLSSQTVYVDIGQLVRVPASADFPTDRYYTKGGLLEVSGELALRGRTIGELTAPGGSITLAAGSVVAQPGAVLDIAGGAVDHAAGRARTSWLIGTDGRLYNINTAPANIAYAGVYGGFTVDHPRWGQTEVYGTPLIAPSTLPQSAYSVGRDGGRLTLSSATVVFEGDLEAGVATGERQTGSRAGQPADPFLQSDTTVPLPGQLVVSNVQNTTAGGDLLTRVDLDETIAPLAAKLSVDTAIPAARIGTVGIAPSRLAPAGLGGLSLRSRTEIDIASPVTLAPGGAVSLVAPTIAVTAPITARGGSVSFTNEGVLLSGTATNSAKFAKPVAISLAGAPVDTRGLFSNLFLAPNDGAGAAFVNGGPVSIISAGRLDIDAGSPIDASSGGVVQPGRTITGGTGGDISLAAYDVPMGTVQSGADPVKGSPFTLAGALRSLGSTNGGGLSISVPDVVITDAPMSVAPSASGRLVLGSALFRAGFSRYTITGLGIGVLPMDPTKADVSAVQGGVDLAKGTQLTVVEPVLMAGLRILQQPTGSDPGAAFDTVLPPVYLANPDTAMLTRRQGADLRLVSSNGGSKPMLLTGGSVTVEDGAVIAVDPGRSVGIEAAGQITFNGRITAPGGTVSVINDLHQTAGDKFISLRDAVGASGFITGKSLTSFKTSPPATTSPTPMAVFTQSIWLGPGSVIDVSAKAFTAVDRVGRPFGTVPAGGTVTLGSPTSLGASTATDSLVIARPASVTQPGSKIAADGTAAVIDRNAGRGGAAAPTTVASAGGSLVVRSASGIFLDGDLHARSGGAGAAGGGLDLELVSPSYGDSLAGQADYVPSNLIVPRILEVSASARSPLAKNASVGTTLVQTNVDSPLLAQAFLPFLQQVFGTARLSTEQVTKGGFGSLTLLSGDAIVFDGTDRKDGTLTLGDGTLTLGTGQSISLITPTLGSRAGTSRVVVASPYVRLNGILAGRALSSPEPLNDGAVLSLFGLDRLGIGPSGGKSQYVPSPDPSTAELDVQAAEVDVAGQIAVGASDDLLITRQTTNGVAQYSGRQLTTLSQVLPRTRYVDIPGFAKLSLASTGDIRFLSGPSDATTLLPTVTQLSSSGDIALAGSRIYPVGGANALVFAGYDVRALLGVSPDTATGSSHRGYDTGTRLTIPITNAVRPASTLAILPVTGGSTAPPRTVGGALELIGGTISQGGTVLAPFGTLEFGADPDKVGTFEATLPPPDAVLNTLLSFTSTISFLPGSRTSVSGLGVTALGGGTADNVTYVNQPSLASLISLFGQSVDVMPRATLDLRGGGTVLGAAFVSGRGGSVDILTSPLPTLTTAGTLPTSAATLAANPVYAILPGADTAQPDITADSRAESPLTPGQTITVGAGVPGLPAGTYTLLPGRDALLPGAFRVQLGAAAPGTVLATAAPVNNGSYQVEARLGTGLGTGLRDPLPRVALVTPGSLLGAYAQYSRIGIDDYTRGQAARFGTVRGRLTADSGTLALNYAATPAPPGQVALVQQGSVLLAPAAGGLGATVTVVAAGPLEVTPAGATPTIGDVAVSAADLDAFGAPQLDIGSTKGNAVFVRAGATLDAAEVQLLSTVSITVEAGVVITTVGHGQPPRDPAAAVNQIGSTSAGSPPGLAIVVVSNQTLGTQTNISTTPIRIGAVPAKAPPGTAGGAILVGEGTVGILSAGPVSLDPGNRYGANNLQIDVPVVNFVPAGQDLAALTPGLTLTQTALNRLLGGDPSIGAPPLRSLILTSKNRVNFYGNVALDTRNPATGISSLDLLELVTPDIVGVQAAVTDVASLSLGTLIWNSLGAPAGAASGPGALRVDADRIVLGYAPTDIRTNADPTQHPRALSGFAAAILGARNRITANSIGSLTAYGDLTLATPLLTGDPGSLDTITATGNLAVAGTGAPPGAAALAGTAALGAEIALAAQGGVLANATTIYLPSGRVTLSAATDVTLQAGSNLRLPGLVTSFFDQSRASWGGDVVITAGGAVTEAAGASIDVSAPAVPGAGPAATGAAAGAAAGSVQISAPGLVALNGTLAAGAPAGFTGGRIDIAGQLGPDPTAAFAALNQALDAGGATGARRLELRAGSLAVGGIVRARTVDISVDAGSLTIAGTLDASGAAPGTIRLAAAGNLVLAPGTVLDAHGTVLQVDSDGVAIPAENRGDIALASAKGRVQLGAGTVIDLLTPDGVAHGRLAIDVPRADADLGLDVAGPVAVRGATGAVTAWRAYVPTGGTVNQAVLNATGVDSAAFIDGAGVASAARLGLLGGAALRPGVELDSAAGGDLTVAGDIELHGLRYGPGGDQPGTLLLRAAGKLTVRGSITDGFATPMPTDSKTREYSVAALCGAASCGGPQSWSLRLVAGADLAAADTRALRPLAALRAIGSGTLTLAGSGATVNVVRTGIGDVELLAGNAITETASYGVYTAGAPSDPLDTAFQAKRSKLPGKTTVLGTAPGVLPNDEAIAEAELPAYPDGGGNVLIQAQGDLSGHAVDLAGNFVTGRVGNWLWRQGGAPGQPAAWWINFGSYVEPLSITAKATADTTPVLASFAGIGTLGGGNLTVLVGGNAGLTGAGPDNGNSQAVDFAVASTGRVLGGVTRQTGGGDLKVRVGGAFNMADATGSAPNTALNGSVTVLRGRADVQAGTIGVIAVGQVGKDASDPRAPDPLKIDAGAAAGAPDIILGDATASLNARRDVVLGGVGDAGRQQEQSRSSIGGVASQESWFTLWRPGTSIDLFAVGGNLAFERAGATPNNNPDTNGDTTETRALLPPTLRAIAASGSLSSGGGTFYELAPSPAGQLDVLVTGSINPVVVGGIAPTQLAQSGAGITAVPTPAAPAYITVNVAGFGPGNTSTDGYDYSSMQYGGRPALFAFGPDSASGVLHASDAQTDRIYAGGDISNLIFGYQYFNQLNLASVTRWLISAKPVAIRAGRDIVSSGFPTDSRGDRQQSTGTDGGPNGFTGDFFLNNNPGDVSVVSAGRDIISANIDIAGPGNLVVEAGRNIDQTTKFAFDSNKVVVTQAPLGGSGSAATASLGGVLDSIGRLDASAQTRSGGAGITVLAGLGAQGPNWTGFESAYLDPANQAAPGASITTGPDAGKVPVTYGGGNGLVAFLQQTYGYTGGAQAARAFFDALSQDQRDIYLLQIYFDELRTSGREFNDPSSPRTKSYVRGERAVANLFPADRSYRGDITFSTSQSGAYVIDSGLRTDFGGGITLVLPGGQLVLGTAGSTVPGARSGVLTQGSGDINIFTDRSVLLGQSRIFTTFGGGITIWSSRGDINAGRGSKSTSVAAPSSTSYDLFGTITQSPNVPTSGAGIATLAPVAGTVPGDVDLIAPLGTIDAGEAGIRVSGNVNLAALTVVNAANVQVGGKSTGLPAVAVPNLGALSAASAAAGAQSQSAQQSAPNPAQKARPQPSVITVDVVIGG